MKRVVVRVLVFVVIGAVVNVMVALVLLNGRRSTFVYSSWYSPFETPEAPSDDWKSYFPTFTENWEFELPGAELGRQTLDWDFDGSTREIPLQRDRIISHAWLITQVGCDFKTYTVVRLYGDVGDIWKYGVVFRAGFPLRCFTGVIDVGRAIPGVMGSALLDRATSVSGCAVWRIGAGSTVILPYHPLGVGLVVNSLVFAASAWVLWTAPATVRRWVRFRRCLCPDCSYPIGTSPVCTECGKPIPARALRSRVGV